MMDITRDRQFSHLYQILRDNATAAEFVKEASVPTEEEWDSYPDTAFADQSARAYPVIDEKHTALSILYANEYGAPAAVVDQLKIAAEIYGLDEDVFSPGKQLVKTAAEDVPATYLLPDQGLYPIYDEDTVKVAADYIVDNYGNMLHDDRLAYCDNLVKVASEFGVDIPDDVYRIAGKTHTDVPTLRNHVLARKAWARDAQVKVAYAKIEGYLSDLEPEILDEELQSTLVNLLYDVDKLANFDGRYGTRILDPVNAVYNTTKTAEINFAMGPYKITPQKLASIDPDVLGAIAGTDLVDAIKEADGSLDFQEAASILPTLPRDIQQTMGRVFRL